MSRVIAGVWLALALPCLAGPHEAAQGVLERFIGPRAREIHLELIPTARDRMVFEVEASGGVVRVRGSDGVALCRGAYEYLRDDCHSMFSMAGAHVELPERWPDRTLTRAECPHRWTISEGMTAQQRTLAWYHWPEWERRLDWLALHGLNLAFAPPCYGAVWARVWQEFGLSRDESAEATELPALPWWLPSRLEVGEQVRPSDGYFARSSRLGRRVLGRMRELGIEPIVRGFDGLVPQALQRARPGLPLIHQPWLEGCDALYLDPLSPAFREISVAYHRAWEREYGRCRLYLCDGLVALPAAYKHPGLERSDAELAALGQALADAARAGDEKAVWVLEGGVFLDSLWTAARCDALLSRVASGAVLVLDSPGAPWSLSPLGARPRVRAIDYGTIPFILNRHDTDLLPPPSGPGDGHDGAGIYHTALEDDDLALEFISDQCWALRAIERESWLERYFRARYGPLPDRLKGKTEAMARCVQEAHWQWAPLFWRPLSANPQQGPLIGQPGPVARAADEFLSCARALGDAPLYRRDALEVSTALLISAAANRLALSVNLAVSGQDDLALGCDREGQALLAQADRLLASHPLWRLSRTLAMARGWGSSPEEADLFVRVAKASASEWGLYEGYTAAWSGMLSAVQGDRWQAWREAVLAGGYFDSDAWRDRWAATADEPVEIPYERPMREARRLCATAPPFTWGDPMRTAWGEAGPTRHPSGAAEWDAVERDVTDIARGASSLSVLCQWTPRTAGEVVSVLLARDGVAVATGEIVEGRSVPLFGTEPYVLRLVGVPVGRPLTLRVRARCRAGWDPSLCVWVRPLP